MEKAAPSPEFLVPDGYDTTPENRDAAARNNELNLRKVQHMERLLDEGKSFAEAVAIIEGTPHD